MSRPAQHLRSGAAPSETGGLFGADNGPDQDDELNYVVAGRNYDWPDHPPGSPVTGYQVKLYPEVFAPTGFLFYTAAAFGAEYANNLFIGGYVASDIRRLHMSGAAYTDSGTTRCRSPRSSTRAERTR